MDETISRCRVCDSDDLALVVDLGSQPLANALVDPASTADEARHPLTVLRCRACSMVQLSVTVPPAEMFSDYPYFSSVSTSFVEQMGTLASRTIDHEGLDGGSMVVEIASNDGYLLGHYVDAGIPVLGIDPAANIAVVARKRGVPTLVEFFGNRLAAELASTGTQADVLHANNVIAHVPDLNDVLAGLAVVLGPGAVAVIETPYLPEMIRRLEFDTIYHEHVYYHSLTSLGAAFERHGLVVSDVERLATHGGSVRLFVRHAGAPVTAAVTQLLHRERADGIDQDDYYAAFAGKIAVARDRAMGSLTTLRDGGAAIAGYGAAAKATVLCNYFGITRDLVDFVVDRSPAKQGKLLPGVGIPILHPDELVRRAPDAAVLFAWNLRDEIVDQQQDYLDGGGSFIVPMPEWTTVTA